MTTTVAERFVDAFSRRDRDALLVLFTPEVDFRGMTPGRFWDGRIAWLRSMCSGFRKAD